MSDDNWPKGNSNWIIRGCTQYRYRCKNGHETMSYPWGDFKDPIQWSFDIGEKEPATWRPCMVCLHKVLKELVPEWELVEEIEPGNEK